MTKPTEAKIGAAIAAKASGDESGTSQMSMFDEDVIHSLVERAEKAEAERDAYKSACRSAGVCMSCVLRAPEPYGCTDCLNTGWDGGDPREQINFVEAQRDEARASAADWKKRAFGMDDNGVITALRAEKVEAERERYEAIEQMRTNSSISQERIELLKAENDRLRDALDMVF